jgi:hypothetical protein
MASEDGEVRAKRVKMAPVEADRCDLATDLVKRVFDALNAVDLVMKTLPRDGTGVATGEDVELLRDTSVHLDEVRRLMTLVQADAVEWQSFVLAPPCGWCNEAVLSIYHPVRWPHRDTPKQILTSLTPDDFRFYSIFDEAEQSYTGCMELHGRTVCCAKLLQPTMERAEQQVALTYLHDSELCRKLQEP